jgi:tetratricopeptide (TPR) repeat protein
MNIRRQLNVKAAGWLLGIVILLGAGLALLHSYQVVRHSAVLLRQADRAVEQNRPDQALRYYKLYLSYQPNDVDARARYGLALEKYAGDHENALLEFDQVLRRDPNRNDVRFRLVHCLINLQRRSEAIEQAEKLLPAWDKKGELEHIIGWCCEAEKRYGEAAEWFRKAIVLDPKHIESYALLADILREHPEVTPAAYAITPAADAGGSLAVMDALVQANPDSYRAYLLRRRTRMLLNKDEDPEEMALAEAQQRDETVSARALLAKGLEVHSEQPALYKALAQLEISAGRPAEAEAVLQRGVKNIPAATDLLVLLTSLQIDLLELAPAEQNITDMRRLVPTSPLPDYFQARVLMGRREWTNAIALLERTRERVSGTIWSAKLHLQLGWCFRQIGDTEQQLAAFARAAKEDPSLAVARAGMGSALLALGRFDEAYEFLKQATKESTTKQGNQEVPAEAWTDLTRCLLLRNLRRPEKERNWVEVNLAFEQAAHHQPRSVETVILQAEIAAAEKNFDPARKLLEAAQLDFPKSVALECALADLLLRQRDFAGALAVLELAEKNLGESVELRQAQLRLWGGQPSEHNRQEATRLGENLQAFSGPGRARLLRDLAETWVRLSDPAMAEKFWRRLIEEQPSDLRARLSLLELSLQMGRIDQARQIVADLRKIEGEKGIYWHYAAAALLLAESMGPNPRLDQARKHLAECYRNRRDWGRLPLLEAQIDEMEGRFEDAVKHYKEAFQLGERTPRMVSRLIKLMQERREFVPAEIIFRSFAEQGPLQPDMARLGAELALANNDVDRALVLGRQAVPADSRDYRDYLWLAHLYQAGSKFDLANELLAEARALAPHSPDVWVAIVEHLALSGRAAEVPRLLGQVQKFVPPYRLAFTQARCYEVLGQFDLAEQYYRQAMGQRPDDYALLAAVCDFFRQSDQPDKAVPLLRRLLEPASTAPFALQAPARQQLALILAATAKDGVQQALDLLGSGSYPDDECTRYLVLGFDPARRDEAVKTFDDFRKRNPLSAEELFYFARIQSAAGNTERARDLLRELVSGNPDNPQYLAYFTRSLLQGGDVNGAVIYGQKLERHEPDSPRTRELKALVLQARPKS